MLTTVPFSNHPISHSKISAEMWIKNFNQVDKVKMEEFALAFKAFIFENNRLI